MAGPRATRAVLVALFVVLSSIGAVVPMAAPTAASPSGFVGIPDHNVHRSDHAVNPASPPNGTLPAQAAGGSNGNGPSGQAGPPAFVHDKIPDHALDRVMSSRHASSTSIQFATTNKAHLAMVVTDDENHEGRTIAVPTETFVETMGEVPGVSYGVHENGTTWRTAVEVEDGYALIEIPSFSTNTVTWSGQFVHEGTPADDGHSFTYNVSNTNDVTSSSYVINVTGATNKENETESGTFSDGGALSLSIGGTTDPEGHSGATPQVTFTGIKETNDESHTGSNIVDKNVTISVDGNKPLDSNKIEITSRLNRSTNSATKEIRTADQPCREWTLNSPPSTFDQLVVDYGSYSQGSSDDTDTASVEVSYVTGEGSDGSCNDGTDVGSHNDAETLEDTSKSYTFDSANSNNQVTVQVRFSGFDLNIDATLDINEVHVDSRPNKLVVSLSDGQSDTLQFSNTSGTTKTASVTIDRGTEWVDLDGTEGEYDYTISYTEVNVTEDPSVDVDGDGVTDASVSGFLSNGATKTKSLGNLTLSSSSADVSTTNSTNVTIDVKYQEITETVDPSVEVNGNWANHTGTVSDGSTVSLTTNTDWLVNGTNRVNISVGDGTLTDDAPTPQVDLYYTHEGEDKSEVTFSAEKWSESYNISKTYAEDQPVANLTIPFDSSDVVRIRNVEKQINGGGFSSVDAANYTLDGTTLTVEFGSVSKNDKVQVRVNGSKVSPNNATITVLEATTTGSSALDSKIRVDSWADDSYIAVGGTEDGAEAHYTTSESWTAAEYVVFEGSSKQKLYLPSVSAGDTFRVNTIPVEIDTAQGGDVRIEVTSTDSTPAFRVKPGPGGGGSTTVWYKYLDASTGVSYELYSLTNGVVRDSGEASSPVTLEDDDSDEELEVRESSDGGTSSDGSGGGGGGGGTTILVDGTGPAANPLLVIGGVVAAILVLFVLGRRFGLGGGGVRGNLPLLLGSGILAVVAVETISPGTVSSIFQFGLTATTGVGAIVIGLALLVLVVTIDARVFKLPTIVRLFAFGSIGLYLANALTNGALEAGLARVSPLLWLLGGVAVVIAVWRSLRGPTFQVIARRQE